jgi:hypothetical protein
MIPDGIVQENLNSHATLLEERKLVSLDPMKGMIARYLVTSRGPEMIHGYLSSPEGPASIREYLTTPAGKQMTLLLLPNMPDSLNLPEDVNEKIRIAISEKP